MPWQNALDQLMTNARPCIASIVEKQNTDESVAEFVAALKLAYHEAWPKADGKIKDDDLKKKIRKRPAVNRNAALFATACSN